MYIEQYNLNKIVNLKLKVKIKSIHNNMYHIQCRNMTYMYIDVHVNHKFKLKIVSADMHLSLSLNFFE